MATFFRNTRVTVTEIDGLHAWIQFPDSDNLRRVKVSDLDERTPAPLATLRTITAANVAAGNVITEQPAACYVCGRGEHAPVDDAYSTHSYWSNADAAAEFAAYDARAAAPDTAAAYVAEHRPY